MKKMFFVLLTITLCLSIFSGCANPNNNKINIPSKEIHTDYEGIYLTLESITDTSIIVKWHNDTDKEAIRGEDYNIEIYNAGTATWESVMVGEHIFEAIAVGIMSDSESQKTYSTTGFDLSKEGTYRLRCEFNPGDGTTCNTWVEFEVANDTSNTNNDRSIIITIEHTLPSCIAIEEDCFYGTDESGHLWRILYSYTSDLAEGKTYSVTVKDVKELTYPDGYPDGGWSPKYEATALEVNVNSDLHGDGDFERGVILLGLKEPYEGAIGELFPELSIAEVEDTNLTWYEQIKNLPDMEKQIENAQSKIGTEFIIILTDTTKEAVLAGISLVEGNPIVDYVTPNYVVEPS